MTDAPSIPPSWKPFATKLSPDWTDLLAASNRREKLSALNEETLNRLLSNWILNAHPAQLPPADDDWGTWLFLGGRGAGKTRAGAEWLTSRAVPGARLALVAPTLHDVREVMIEGPSGLRAVAEAAGNPASYEVSRRRLKFETGALAYAFSAEDPDSLRGPQFHHAWADEFCAWRGAEAVLAQLRLGLRLGRRPRLVVTTTPKPIRALRRLMAEADTVMTRAGTDTNAANLSPAFLDGLNRLYGGTRLAVQELEGQVVDLDGASLWRAEDFHRLRRPGPERYDRVVLAVDPTASRNGAACGLIVAGRFGDQAHVIADRTTPRLSPMGWATRAAETARAFRADLVVAEANQGGEMVRTLIAIAGCPVPVKLVHARLAKRLRAEPVAALYEQGRVSHAMGLFALEEELLALGATEDEGGDSPDRADALVWALTELLLEHGPGPRVGRI
jgi:phage terminase large subunit-like protein